MSGGSLPKELKERLEGFELKQTRERIEVLRLKSKIAGKVSILNLNLD